MEDVLDHGEIHLTSSVAGVTLFMPPDAPASTPAQHDAYQRRLRAYTGDFAERAVLVSRFLEERHPQQRPHYYLIFGAARPAQQGKGSSARSYVASSTEPTPMAWAPTPNAAPCAACASFFATVSTTCHR
ncbi:MAG: hypothetical protein ACRDRW_22090 [Pseudonocardiaceae bacterium]